MQGRYFSEDLREGLKNQMLIDELIERLRRIKTIHPDAEIRVVYFNFETETEYDEALADLTSTTENKIYLLSQSYIDNETPHRAFD